MSKKKQHITKFFNEESAKRSRRRSHHKYFYRLVENYLNFYVPDNASVLVVGCGTGELLDKLKPRRGVGIDISPGMIAEAKKNFPEYEFQVQDIESLQLDEVFDVVIFSDVIGLLDDIQVAFEQVRQVCDENTRVMITYFNIFWQYPLRLAETLRMKMRPPAFAWIEPEDIVNLLQLADFEVIRKNMKILLPVYIPILSWIMNFFVANLPLIRRLCLMEMVSARIKPVQRSEEKSVTVLIPTRNERGNVADALNRLPEFGKHSEVIFVDGHSTDGTLEEVEKQAALHPDMNISWYTQDGKGKGDAVRKGFAMASGDILMILDADLTVPPEELPKFYEAIVTGKGEFINGSRLVYPMEDRAMRFLNVLGNKFFSLAFTWLLDQRFKDTLCGTKVLSKTHYDQLAANRHYFGDFDPFGDFDLIFGAAKLNLKIAEIPIRYRERVYGDTNISRFSHGFILLKMCFYAYKKIKMI